MKMNCHSELDDELQLVDAEGAAHYHMMTGSVNWAIALGRHDIQHAVSAPLISSSPHHSSYHSSNGLIIPACTSIKLHVTARGNHKAVLPHTLDEVFRLLEPSDGPSVKRLQQGDGYWCTPKMVSSVGSSTPWK
jgi:hypothetical protein